MGLLIPGSWVRAPRWAFSFLRRPSVALLLLLAQCQESAPRLWSTVRYGLVARIPGSHPGGSGSIPGIGTILAGGLSPPQSPLTSPKFLCRPPRNHTAADPRLNALLPCSDRLHLSDLGAVSLRETPSPHDEVAEWLRRWTANPMGSARVSSNLILVGLHFRFA